MSPNKAFTWDVFISHNRKQKVWVRDVFRQWIKLGLTVFFDEENIKPGESIVDGIVRGLKGSSYVVLILTPESVKSKWVAMEQAISLYNSSASGDHRVIPVLLEPVEVPDGVGYLNLVDLSVPDPNERKKNYHRLLRQLGVKKPRLPALPSYESSSSTTARTGRPFSLVRNGKVLAIGAHWDDILLGCFGTLLKLKLFYGYEVIPHVLCNNYGQKYYGEKQPDLDAKVQRIFDEIETRHGIHWNLRTGTSGRFNEIRDRNFHDSSQTMHEAIKKIATENEDCNLILTPPMDDGHEDHAFTGQLVFSYFRKTHQTILEYEIKRYLEKHFVPNVFISLDDKCVAESKGRKNAQHRTVGDLKIELLSELLTKPRTGIAGSNFLFGIESLRARLVMQALNYSGDKNIKYGEAFRGRISI